MTNPGSSTTGPIPRSQGTVWKRKEGRRRGRGEAEKGEGGENMEPHDTHTHTHPQSQQPAKIGPTGQRGERAEGRGEKRKARAGQETEGVHLPH